MKNHILDFKDITDSREIFEAKTPPFMSIFIYGIFFMITLAFAWMWFGDIDEVVRADGIVRTKNPVSIVTNIVEGEVKEVFIQEDHHVNRGDLLYTLETTLFTIERESVLARLKRLKEKQLICQDKKKYRIYDRLFGEYLHKKMKQENGGNNRNGNSR